jgi:hypothetical protein
MTKKEFKRIEDNFYALPFGAQMQIATEVANKIRQEYNEFSLSDYVDYFTFEMDDNDFINYVNSIYDDSEYSWFSDFKDYFEYEFKVLNLYADTFYGNNDIKDDLIYEIIDVNIDNFIRLVIYRAIYRKIDLCCFHFDCKPYLVDKEVV